MRAAMIKAFGESAEVLELVDVPKPTGPAAGETLVGVEYAPIIASILQGRSMTLLRAIVRNRPPARCAPSVVE
jgi:NADPH:quinone reductase-like Zn-dependent oxidoreductase